MPSYSPLPNIDLDPRNEADLVQAAARRVYEASNATLNDFSSGSPIVALLEGQAFAQAEFLQFANQFPESVLVEWIGPFLGAQRRTGAGARVDITFTIEPRDDQFDVFAGHQIASEAKLTGGESVVFVTTERLVIPAGQTEGVVGAISLFKSTAANVGPNTITRNVTSLAGVKSVTNVQAAGGGQDPELLSEVKERFFSLIRRRNPVSAEDWTDFFSDALGPGASCAVRPRRSEQGVYNYEDNYVSAAPAVSFFVLNPDGSPINTAQQDALQNLLRWSLPVEFIGFVYPMEVNGVDFNIDIEYDSTKPYAQNLTTLSETVRNNLFSVMRPNAVFPIDYNQQVSDVESALTATFPLTLGTTNQYIDPDIASIKAYVPPKGIATSEFTVVSPQSFKAGNAVQEGDLLIERGNTFTVFYEALKSFTPSVNDKSYYVNTGNLDVEIIRSLEEGFYDTGDVVSTGINGDLRVVLTSFTYRAADTLEVLQNRGFLSNPKQYVQWGDGISYISIDQSGAYNPDIIEYKQDDTSFNLFVPSYPANLEANRRPGAAVYVVQKNFESAINTTTLGGAQNQGLVSTTTTQVELLEQGKEYVKGTFIKTPDPTEILTEDISRENCYISQLEGAKQIYAKVLNTFTFTLQNEDIKTSVDNLVKNAVVDIIQPVPFTDCKGESSFNRKPFRYSARFKAGEYIRHRPTADDLDSARYFFVLKDFTPNTTDISSLLDQEVMEEIAQSNFTTSYTIHIDSNRPVYSHDVIDIMVRDGVIPSASSLEIGQTALVIGDNAEERGIYEWNGSLWLYHSPGLPTFRDLFRFAPGDVVTFRSGSSIRNYVAKTHVTPILDLEVYYDNGVFERTNLSETVKWIDPTYHIEDIVVDITNEAYSFYRAIRSFTPPDSRLAWNSTTQLASPRLEEIFGNLLKFVNLVRDSDAISSRLADGASSVKLGRCHFNMTSKSLGSVSNTYVWEETQYSSQSSKLSEFPNSSFEYPPTEYGSGTLAL